MTNERIRQLAAERGITRLCHLTPSRNFIHIAAEGSGLLSTRALDEQERLVFNQNDLQRLDGHADYLCCSIEFPNAWYFTSAARKNRIFKDWVVLLIRPDLLWEETTLFCQRNAAASRGRLVAPGFQAFSSMFADKVDGAGGQVFRRSPTHLSSCPTDNQAEVLIKDKIGQDDIMGVGIASLEQAKAEYARMTIAGIQTWLAPFIIGAHFFKAYALRDLIRVGRRPEETIWRPT